MKQIVPAGDLPDNVRAVRFTPPEGMEDEVGEAVGIAHGHPETGETLALEFMLELTDQEIQVLKHEPYITLTLMSDHLHPFSIQTSYPYDEKYKQLDDHNHICQSNEAHEDNKWWRCENPRHHPITDRIRECDECWEIRTEQPREDDDGAAESDEVD